MNKLPGLFYLFIYLLIVVKPPIKSFLMNLSTTVHYRQMGHVNQVGHLSKAPLNLLEIHENDSVDTSKPKQQNYNQI